MKDIPFFTTHGALATLVLSEIPTKKAAYIIIRNCDRFSFEAVVQDSTNLVRLAGANYIYLTVGFPDFQIQDAIYQNGPTLILSHRIIEMEKILDGSVRRIGNLELMPLTWETADSFLSIYNACYAGVHNSVTYSIKDIERILKFGYEGLLAQSGGRFIGIAELKRSVLCSIAVLPEFRGGAGKQLLAALFSKLQGCGYPVFSLQVSTKNLPAISLYHAMGFEEKRVVSEWYQVIWQ